MKRTKNKVLSVFLSICMIISCMAGLSVTASADSVIPTDGSAAANVTNGTTTTNYSTLADALSAWTDGTTLTLQSDVTTSSTISVSSGTHILDLNGHGITKTGSGSVISVDSGSTLTVQDGDTTTTHKFSVNSATQGAGLATLSSTGDMSFNGGYITGGTARFGGGICVNSGGTLYFDGGTVIGNKADDNSTKDGGGICAVGGTVYIRGGEICYNFANNGGGGGVATRPDGVVTISGGSIHHNLASTGGGVRLDGSNSILTISGGTIEYNVRTGVDPAGGIRVDGYGGVEFHISGAPEIRYNMDSSGNTSNVQLNQPATVEGEMTNTTPIGLKTGISGGIFTNSTNTDYNDPDKFTSEDEAYKVLKNADGQLYIGAPPAASVTNGTTTTNYSTLADALSAWTDGTTLTLQSDVTTSSTISVSSGTHILDLNGYGIRMTGNDRVIKIGSGATLTLNDSDSTKVHYITLSNYRGTAVSDTGNESFSNGSGTIKITGGYITGGIRSSGINQDTAGAGVHNGGTFIMNGGSIVGNTITNNNSGGGIRNQGSFTMNGGMIAYNKAGGNGGGITTNNGTFIMTGGIISNNYADKYGGGVQTAGGTVKFTGGSVTGNICNGGNNNYQGGGVFLSSSVEIFGEVNITGNKSGTTENNFYVSNGKTITLVGALSDNASIGITMENPGVFTNSTNTEYNDPDAFTSDNEAYVVLKNADGQLYIGAPPAASVTNGTTTTNYSTLADALSAWTDGTTLTLQSDVTTSSTISVSSGTHILDLNGHGITKTGSGSVISVDSGSTLTVQDGDTTTTHKFSVNSATQGAGLATLSSTGDMSFNGGYITGGTARFGGGICVNSGGTLYFDGGTVIGNKADDNSTKDGGGICAVGGTVYIRGGEICYNFANNGGGGGVATRPDGVVTISGGSIHHNLASTGGGVRLDGSNSILTISGGTIEYNVRTGVDPAGGIRVDGYGSVEFHISGAPEIRYNMDSSGNPSNLQLNQPATVEGEMTNTTPIGLKTGISGGIFTNSTNTDYNDPDKFTSEDESYAVGKNTQGQLFLGTPVTVTFDANGHGTAPDAQKTVSGCLLSKPEDPSADNYTFGGWYKEEACENEWDFDSDTVTADTTLYAKWTSSHIHTWAYAADGAAITANCGGTGDCDITPAPTLTLTAPTLTAAGGTGNAEATVTASDTWTEANGLPAVPSVVYYKGTTMLDAAPTTAGEYTAKITVGTATAEVTYSITASYTVTFKVANGSWDDGTTADKTVTLTGTGELKLAATDIPAAGATPNSGFKAGAWDITPDTVTAITADKTYTYTYAVNSSGGRQGWGDYTPVFPVIPTVTTSATGTTSPVEDTSSGKTTDPADDTDTSDDTGGVDEDSDDDTTAPADDTDTSDDTGTGDEDSDDDTTAPADDTDTSDDTGTGDEDHDDDTTDSADDTDTSDDTETGDEDHDDDTTDSADDTDTSDDTGTDSEGNDTTAPANDTDTSDDVGTDGEGNDNDTAASADDTDSSEDNDVDGEADSGESDDSASDDNEEDETAPDSNNGETAQTIENIESKFLPNFSGNNSFTLVKDGISYVISVNCGTAENVNIEIIEKDGETSIKCTLDNYGREVVFYLPLTADKITDASASQEEYHSKYEGQVSAEEDLGSSYDEGTVISAPASGTQSTAANNTADNDLSGKANSETQTANEASSGTLRPDKATENAEENEDDIYRNVYGNLNCGNYTGITHLALYHGNVLTVETDTQAVKGVAEYSFSRIRPGGYRIRVTIWNGEQPITFEMPFEVQ